MRRILPSILIVMIVLSLPRMPVVADILFIDMNNSPTEVQAAWRAAQARGENLYTIPTVSGEVTQHLNEYRQNLHKAGNAKQKACAVSGDSDLCAAAKASYGQVESAGDSLLRSIPKLDNNQLSVELAKFKKANINLSSLIISGHHTDQEYFGVSASLSQSGIEKAFVKNKPLGDSIRSVYAWGCYAATTDDFMKNWKEAFPNTTMMGGFSGEAPSNSRPSSSNLLEDLLEKEKQFDEARDRDEMKEIFDSLADISHVKAQVCLNHETVVSSQGARTIADDINACGHRSKLEQKMSGIYHCYLNADAGCEDPPDDENEGNPLRKAYNYFQETRHCDEILEQKGTPREVNQVRVRRLLFDKQILASFERLNKAEFAKMNALIDELGLPKDLRFENFWHLSRKQYLAKKSQLEKAVALRMDELRDDQGRVLDARLLAMDKYLGAIDKVERGECTPLEWIEEDPVLHDSKCGVHQAMKSAEADAQAEVSAQLAMPVSPAASRARPKYYNPGPSGQ